MRNLAAGKSGSSRTGIFDAVTLLLLAILTAALGAALLAAAIPPDGAAGMSDIDDALRDLGVFTTPVLGMFTA